MPSSKGKDRKSSRRLGAEIVDALSELHAALSAGQKVSKLFTVRKVKLNLRPRAYDAEAVRATRSRIGVSQSLFAQLMSVSTNLVQSWEQGIRVPKPIACRLLDEMNLDPARWQKRLEAAIRAA